MGTKELDEIISYLNKSLITCLLEDVILEEYKLIAIRRIKFLGIGTSNSIATTSNTTSTSSLPTPKILINIASSGNNSRSNSPSGNSSNGKKDNSALCDCLNCGRSIAFSRYASHLSGCMDLKNGSRSRRIPANGLKKRPMNGSVSPYPSDDERKNVVKLSTSSKRAASPTIVSAAAIANLKFKKLKPNLSTPGLSLNQPGMNSTITSHPLSKSLSLPVAPAAPSLSLSIPTSNYSSKNNSPTSPNNNSNNSPTSTSMISRNSLPPHSSLPNKPPPISSVFNNNLKSNNNHRNQSLPPQSQNKPTLQPRSPTLTLSHPLPLPPNKLNGNNKLPSPSPSPILMNQKLPPSSSQSKPIPPPLSTLAKVVPPINSDRPDSDSSDDEEILFQTKSNAPISRSNSKSASTPTKGSNTNTNKSAKNSVPSPSSTNAPGSGSRGRGVKRGIHPLAKGIPSSASEASESEDSHSD